MSEEAHSGCDKGRTGRRGSSCSPLDEAALEALADTLAAGGFGAVEIGSIHADGPTPLAKLDFAVRARARCEIDNEGGWSARVSLPASGCLPITSGLDIADCLA